MQSLVTQRRLTVQAEETRALGARLGRWARVGDIVACRGALGAGKTTFVQGFAEGLGVGGDAYVRSPTFALVHAYHGRILLYHFDFYRLSLVLRCRISALKNTLTLVVLLLLNGRINFLRFYPRCG